MFAALAGVSNPAKVGQFSVALSRGVSQIYLAFSMVYHPMQYGHSWALCSWRKLH